MQKYRYHYMTWIAFDEEFAPFQWAHLPIHHIFWENNLPAWVLRPTCGWEEISSGEKICLDTRYRSSELLVMSLVYRSAAEEVLKKKDYYSKISRASLQWETVDHNIRRAFSLPNICVLVTKSRLNILELENQEMKSTICALNE